MMRTRLIASAMLLTAALAEAAVSDDAAASVLPEMPGWTAEPGGASGNPLGVLAMRSYHRGPEKAVVTVTFGQLADGIAEMLTTSLPEQLPPPLPQDRWQERGYRLWETQRDGFAYEVGMVVNYVSGHPEWSADVSITGEQLPLPDALTLLHALDWDQIKSLAAQ